VCSARSGAAGHVTVTIARVGGRDCSDPRCMGNLPRAWQSMLT
jgi:hypothetical protein